MSGKARVQRYSYIGVTCSECDNPARAKGLCINHYNQQNRKTHYVPTVRTSYARKCHKVNLEECLRLRTEGRTLQYIADIYGVSREAIRQLIKRHGETENV